MSKFFCLCRANSKKHGLKDQNLNLNKKRNSFNACFGLSILLIFCVFALSVFYVFNITSSATSGFKISEQEQRIFELKLANEALKNKTRSFEDLNYIKEQANNLGLVLAGEVEYLDISLNSMAALK